MDYIDKIHELLKDNGATLERTKKHKVWRFPDGRIWVVAGSPRSDNSYKTNYHDLCDFLGISNVRRKNPNRAPKKGVQRRDEFREIAQGGPRDFIGVLAALKRYIRPAPCPNAMWLERISATPLECILRNLWPPQ